MMILFLHQPLWTPWRALEVGRLFSIVSRLGEGVGLLDSQMQNVPGKRSDLKQWLSSAEASPLT